MSLEIAIDVCCIDRVNYRRNLARAAQVTRNYQIYMNREKQKYAAASIEHGRFSSKRLKFEITATKIRSRNPKEEGISRQKF